MKKSVVILIGVIYFAAVALVSFFGLQFQVFKQDIEVTSVEILNESVKDGQVTIYLDDSGKAQFLVEYQVLPNEATNKNVRFLLTNFGETQAGSIDSSGMITFNGEGVAQVQVFAEGTDKHADFFIIVKKKN